MVSYIKENFNRKVSGSYNPGIDSLRFIVILFIVTIASGALFFLSLRENINQIDD